MEILEATKEDFDSIYEIEKTSTNEVMSLEELKYEFNENPVAKFMILKDDNGEIVSYIDYWITFDSSTIFKIVTKESASMTKKSAIIVRYLVLISFFIFFIVLTLYSYFHCTTLFIFSLKIFIYIDFIILPLYIMGKVII